MSNEAALLTIVAIWLCTGTGVNLCLLIMLYYVAYITTTSFPSQIVYETGINETISYYLLQTTIDSSMLLSCFAISVMYKRQVVIYALYAAIVLSSLVCELMMLLDQGFMIGALLWLHSARQQVSIPLDLIFAVIGSAAGERLFVSFFLRTGGGSGYNRDHGNQRIHQANKCRKN